MSLTGVTGRRSCSTQDHRHHTPATSLYCLCCVHSVCVSAVQCELHLRVQTHLHNLPYILPSRPPAPLSAPPGPDSRRWAGAGGIISLSIKKLAEKAKSPPCQPRLAQGPLPLCAPWQPQAVREQIRYTLAAPGCQKRQNLPPDSPKLSESQCQ